MELVNTTETNTEAKAKVASKTVTKRSQSKKVLALSIYSTKIAEGKEAVIQSFIQDLAMSKAGATTYFYNCKKLQA
jgi:hypothetical protein